MKYLLLIPLLSFVINDQDIISYRAECLEMNEDGVLRFLIWDKDAGKKYKIEQAEKDAVAFVLYEGFRGGVCEYIAPLLKSYEVKHDFEDSDMYFFKKSGNYKDFIEDSRLSEFKPDKVKEEDWTVYEISIKRKSLDQYLVDKRFREQLDD